MYRKINLIWLVAVPVLLLNLIATNSGFTRAIEKNHQMVQHLETLQALQSDSRQEYLKLNYPQLAAVMGDTTVYDSILQNGISGTLFGLTPEVYESAYVEAFWADSLLPDGFKYKGLAFVERDGTYKLMDLLPGRYYVLAFAKGYELLYYENVLQFELATAIEVKPNEITPGIDFKMQKIVPGTGSISGKVFDAKTKKPIPLVNLYAYSQFYGSNYGSVMTDENGNYKITELKSDSYYVTANAENYLVQYFDRVPSADNASLVTVLEPKETTGIDFYLSEGGKISGIIIDKKGLPLEGIYVYVETALKDSIPGDPGGDMPPYAYGKAITDSNGRYTIAALPTGNYWVNATIWQEWYQMTVWYPNAANPLESTPVAVVDGETTDNINFQLNFTATTGSVSGAVVDQNDKPLVDVTVTIQSASDSSPNFYYYNQTQTDAAGQYKFSKVPAGYYYVAVYYYSNWQYYFVYWPNSESFENAKKIEVSEEIHPDGINFKLNILNATSSISGRITADDGHPLFSAYINIYQPAVSDPTGAYKYQINAWANSDIDGNYTVKGLPAGSYYVQASYWQDNNFGQQWYQMAATEKEAKLVVLGEDDQRGQIDFSMKIEPQYGFLAGVVTDEATGLPINRAYIELTPIYSDLSRNCFAPWRFNQHVVTDEKGRYKIEYVYKGEYYISAYANGAFEIYKDAVVMEEATPVKIVGGDTTMINFDLEKLQNGNGIISGKVMISGSETPIDIAVVIARPTLTILVWPLSEMFYTALTEKDGSYSMKGLPAGEYIVSSFAPWNVAQYYKEVYDPESATLVVVSDEKPAEGINFNLPLLRWLKNDIDYEFMRNSTTIYGQVKNANGQPVEGAFIYVMDSNREPVVYVTTTIDGKYQINGLTPGDYVLQAGKHGFRNQYNGTTNDKNQALPLNLQVGTYEVNFVLDAGFYPNSVNDNPKEIPTESKLLGNYPNPFNPETKIAFAMSEKQQVQIKIYNILGELIQEMNPGTLNSGIHQVIWNSNNRLGQPVGSGLYFYRIYIGQKILFGKMLLLR